MRGNSGRRSSTDSRAPLRAAWSGWKSVNARVGVLPVPSAPVEPIAPPLFAQRPGINAGASCGLARLRHRLVELRDCAGEIAQERGAPDTSADRRRQAVAHDEPVALGVAWRRRQRT